MTDCVSTNAIYYPNESYLSHHGIKGMHWGIRKYQNEDGSLTEAGRKRYYGESDRIQRDIDSYKNYKNGIYAKDGTMLLSKDDVANSVAGLRSRQGKAIAKQLNRLDRDVSKTKHNSATLKKKSLDAALRGDYEKSKKYAAERDKADRAIKLGQDRIDRILQDANKNGFNISSRETQRYVHAGRALAASFLLTPVAGAIPVAVDVYRGKKYGEEYAGLVSGRRYRSY